MVILTQMGLLREWLVLKGFLYEVEVKSKARDKLYIEEAPLR